MKWINNFTNWYFSKNALPYWCIMLLDCIIVMFSGYVGWYYTIGGLNFAKYFWLLTWGLLISLIFFLFFFKIFHTYSGIIRYSSFVDLRRVAYAVICSTFLIWITFEIFHYSDIDFKYFVLPTRRVIFYMLFFATVLMWFVRIAVMQLYDVFRITEITQGAFIYGIKEGGVGLARNLQTQDPQKYKVVGFVSPTDEFPGKLLMGQNIYHDNLDLVKNMKKKGATVLIVSPLQANHFRDRSEIVDLLVKNNIKIMMLSREEEWDGKSDFRQGQLHEVDIEDLLPRDKIEVDMDAIGELLKGKKILITGAAGSIGSEMARQIAVYKPAELILIDQAETPMHDVRLEMARNYSYIKVETIVTSITNKESMEKIFSEHRPDYVFHAAAYKHVPMMEDNPGMAVQNNIYGTRVIADLAVKYETKKFVMISTDKAVNPTNVMGCSKRICEIYCQSLDRAIHDQNREERILQVDGSPAITQFVTTRFGNVLGSSGSVIPIFKEQIQKGGPVTVTDPKIIRYFMLIPEACQLVLEAGTMGKGGEIFVFDMGKPVRIVDLARRMIDLSGVKNIEIRFTGLRDGEKLYEEVLSDTEQSKVTSHPKIRVASVREYSYNQALKNEEELYKLSFSFDDMRIVAKMKEIVPEYKSQHSKYEILDSPQN